MTRGMACGYHMVWSLCVEQAWIEKGQADVRRIVIGIYVDVYASCDNDAESLTLSRT